MRTWLRGYLCLKGFHRVFVGNGQVVIRCHWCNLFVGMRTYTAIGKPPPFSWNDEG